MDRRLRQVGGQSGVGKGVEVQVRGDQHLLASWTRSGRTRPRQAGQRSCRPGAQNQDSQKPERITFVRPQFRLHPIRSTLSENHDLTFNCPGSDVTMVASATPSAPGTTTVCAMGSDSEEFTCNKGPTLRVR